MKYTTLASSLVLFALLGGCVEPEHKGVPFKPVEMPEWARTGHHPQFPDDKFLAAYSLADTPIGAKNASQAGLEKAICNLALTQGDEVLRGSRFAALIDAPAAWIDIKNFGDAVKFDFATNGFESVSVSALSREELKLRSNGLLADARKELKAAPAPMDYNELHHYLEVWGERFTLCARVVALNLIVTGELDRDALRKAEEAGLNLYEAPAHMQVAQQGQSQYAQIGGGLPDDLVFVGVFRDRPAAGLPLMWSIDAPGSGTMDARTETDAQGLSHNHVYSLMADGRLTSSIIARVDLERICGRAIGIRLPPWKWPQNLPSRRQGELLVDIKESADGKPTDATLAPTLLMWCKENRLAYTDDPKHPLVETRHYRLSLTGTLQVKIYSQGADTVARAEGTLTLADAQSGNPIYVYSPAEIRVMQKDEKPDETARRTLIEAAADALAQITPRINAALPEIQK